MGSDCFYRCAQSERPKVERLVDILSRYWSATGQHGIVVQCHQVTLRLPEGPQAADLFGFVDADLVSHIDRDPETGVVTPTDVPQRAQFIFDFARKGQLVSVVFPSIDDYKEGGRSADCLSYQRGGYWRSVGGTGQLPRFLACCKVRYLPDLEFGSDYGEADHFLKTIYEDFKGHSRIACMSEEEFFQDAMTHGIIG